MTLRKRAKLTQRQVAQALDVRESTVSEWERRISLPHLIPSKMKKLLEIYQCSLDDLIEVFESPVSEAVEASGAVKSAKRKKKTSSVVSV